MENKSKITTALLTPGGSEINNPNPKILAAGIGRPATLQEQIQRCLRQELSTRSAEEGNETFEESNDFDIDDTFDSKEPSSEYDLMEEEYLAAPKPPAAETKKPLKENEKQARQLKSVEASEHQDPEDRKAEVSPEPKPKGKE